MTAVVVVMVAVTAMQLVGPRRYALYTFFLTLIALQISSIGHPRDWGIALIRAVLTLVGSAVAVISSLIYDRLIPGAPSSAQERGSLRLNEARANPTRIGRSSGRRSIWSARM